MSGHDIRCWTTWKVSVFFSTTWNRTFCSRTEYNEIGDFNFNFNLNDCSPPTFFYDKSSNRKSTVQQNNSYIQASVVLFNPSCVWPPSFVLRMWQFTWIISVVKHLFLLYFYNKERKNGLVEGNNPNCRHRLRTRVVPKWQCRTHWAYRIIPFFYCAI